MLRTAIVRRSIHAIVAVILTPTIVIAQQKDVVAACTPALNKDRLTYISTDQQRYSYFSQIDEKTFELLKHDADVGVHIPLLGDMVNIISASASYDDFSAKRHEYFAKIGYTSDATREIQDIQVVTSPVAYLAWSECIKAFTTNQKILSAYVDQEDATGVEVKIVNMTAVPVRLTSVLENGSVQGQKAHKAFRDATVVTGGGTLPVLIHRLGKGAMKLSIASDPQVDGLFVISQWGSPPQNIQTGELILTVDSSSVVDKGQKRGDTWHTPNLHNVSCSHAPCMDRWQGAENTLAVTADAGLQLRNPHISCEQDNQGACGWSNDEGAAHCSTEPSLIRATCVVTAGSRDHGDVILADQYQIVTSPMVLPPIPIMIFGKSQFVLKVPKGVKSAVFKYSVGSGSAAMTPGDARSADGLFLLQKGTPAADADYYTYLATR